MGSVKFEPTELKLIVGLEVCATNLYQTSPLRFPTIQPNFPDDPDPTIVPVEFVQAVEEVNKIALETASFTGA